MTTASPHPSFLRLFRAELDRHARRRSTWVGALIMLALCMVARFDGYTDAFDHLLICTTFGAMWGYLTAVANVGGDIRSGALGTWLTFHPRRQRVWWARLLAIIVTTAIGVLATILLITSTHLPAVVTSTGHGLGWGVPVALLVPVCTAIMGAATAALCGSTLSALGVAAGYLTLLFVSSVLIPDLSGTWGPVAPIGDLFDGINNYNSYSRGHPDSGTSYDLPFWAMIRLLIWTLALGVVGTLRWSRRDVD